MFTLRPCQLRFALVVIPVLVFTPSVALNDNAIEVFNNLTLWIRSSQDASFNADALENSLIMLPI